MAGIICPSRVRTFFALLMAAIMAVTPSVSVMAQGLGATQSARGRAFGLAPSETPPAAEPPAAAPNTPESSPVVPASPGYAPGKLDTTYVAPTASAILALRPAQMMTSPAFQMLPIEVASAAGIQYLGVDPADIDEVVAFVEMSNPTTPVYGVTVKFNKPFRASAIPPERRAHAQLSELNGKKYLKSGHPLLPSFYGPNNKTLVLAPDTVMETLVTQAGQSKSGALFDRAREAPSGSDIYLALDAVQLRALIQAKAQSTLPPTAKPYIDALGLVNAAELTFNLAASGATSLVIHGNDDAATQELEVLVQGAIAKLQAQSESELASSGGLVQQAIAQYKERMARPFQPTRNGTALTCFQLDGQDGAQRQFTSIALIGGLVALLLPAVQAARNAALRTQGGAGPLDGPGNGSNPSSPDGSTEASPPEASPSVAPRGNEPSALPGGVFLPN